ncbi:MAG: homoserine dehydrogenase, partial [Alphaproteobacteria bacterium]
MSEVMRLGVAGIGTVGTSLLRLINLHGSELAARTGRQVAVVAVSARDRDRDRGVDLSGYRWFDDPVEMARAEDVDVFIELIGGAEGVAKTAVEQVLQAGKHVVTANKALLATYG